MNHLVTWPSCTSAGCHGRLVEGESACVFHVGTDSYLEAALSKVGDQAECNEFAGCSIDGEIVRQILNAATQESSTGPTFGLIDFTASTFESNADFYDADFRQQARFVGARFRAEGNFGAAMFPAGGTFAQSTFEGRAFFKQAHGTRMDMSGANFKGAAGLNVSEFEQLALIDCNFSGPTTVSGRIAELDMQGAVVSENMSFHVLATQALLRNCVFDSRGDIGEIEAKDLLSLQGSTFSETVKIRLTAQGVDLSSVSFLGSTSIEFQGALTLTEAIVSGTVRLDVPPAQDLRSGLETRLLSVRDATVGGLTVGAVDLSNCSFSRARDLDGLLIEAGAKWGSAPGLMGSRRDVIADEVLWRADQPGQRRWKSKASTVTVAHNSIGLGTGSGFEGAAMLTPQSGRDVAGLYRALRRGLETQKNEPGAADFYYGEMELRRKAHETKAGEKMLLWTYLLSSGYALRPLRAFGALAVLVVCTSFAMWLWGFAEPQPGLNTVVTLDVASREVLNGPAPIEPTLLASFRFVLASVTGLLRLPTGMQVTAIGTFLEVATRLLGPLLLALALLAVRSRVKR